MRTRNYFIPLALAGCCSIGHPFCGHAQESDVALAHIKYEFVHIDDTNFRDNPRREDMMLYIGEHTTLYNSFTLAATLENMKKDMAGKQQAGSRFFVNSPNMSNEALYLFPQESSAFIVNKLGTSTYIIPQEYPRIDWQIGEKAKEIGGYQCQQAIGTFGGRTYTAWFTTELPFPYGPWKLHGLPGLILEAEDAKQEVIFRYAGFDKEADGTIALELPKDAVTTTAMEFAKAKTAFDKNPTANALRNIDVPPGANVQRKIVMKDQNGRELSPEEFNAMREMAMKEGKIKKPNNPLELPHK